MGHCGARFGRFWAVSSGLDLLPRPLGRAASNAAVEPKPALKAEGEGFEPSEPGLPTQRFSRPSHSTALPPLRGARNTKSGGVAGAGNPAEAERRRLATRLDEPALARHVEGKQAQDGGGDGL